MRTRAIPRILQLGAVLLAAAPRLLAQSGPAAVSPAKFVAAPAGSAIRVDGDSTLHKWHVESTKVEGSLSFSAADLEAGAWSAPPKAEAKIASTSLKSTEGGGMDKKTWETLQTDKFPVISYRLLEAGAPKAAGAGKWTVSCRGELTVAGKAVEFKTDLTVVRDGAGFTVTGTIPTKMTVFGLKPPTAMMGMVKARDDISISITWKLVAAP